jgi:predicted anti-sigma-YlaC factor YlaD
MNGKRTLLSQHITTVQQHLAGCPACRLALKEHTDRVETLDAAVMGQGELTDASVHALVSGNGNGNGKAA